MPQAAWPRTPGRDWAGVVVEGPGDLVGQEVFGAGGDLGVTRDGTHASHLVVHRDAAVVKPAALSLAEAGALGVPFVTALEGFRRSGMPRPGDVVLVMAANGRVGQAAVQIAAMRGAHVFGVARRAEPFAHAGVDVRMIDASSTDIPLRCARRAAGTVRTSSTTRWAVRILPRRIKRWRMGEADPDRDRRTSGALRHLRVLPWRAHVTSASIRSPWMRVLRLVDPAGTVPGFASGHLKPFPVVETAMLPLERAMDAFGPFRRSRGIGSCCCLP